MLNCARALIQSVMMTQIREDVGSCTTWSYKPGTVLNTHFYLLSFQMISWQANAVCAIQRRQKVNVFVSGYAR